MPPRLGGPSLRTCIDQTLREGGLPLGPTRLTATRTTGVAAAATRIPTAAAAAAAAPFSTTAASQVPLKTLMREWFKGRGAQYARHEPGRTNYIGGDKMQPFPLNPAYRNHPVLDEGARALIWDKVMQRGESLKAVSAELGVDLSRVAAVVRLQDVEKDMIAMGKPLALPYAKAVMGMLPRTSYPPGEPITPHETINDLPVHRLTMQQLFVPVPESRHFTRADAAAAFSDRLLPVDRRVPHPELIQLERDMQAGLDPAESVNRFHRAAEAAEAAVAEREMARLQREEARITRVEGKRFQFRFKEVSVDDVGRDGRSRRGTGWRYGVPFYDRKRGQVKIPTSVE